MSDDLFTRDGHLLEESIDLLALDELEPGQAAAAQAHVDQCDLCAERLAETHLAMGAPLPTWEAPVPPALEPDEVRIPQPANTSLARWIGLGSVGLVVAAVAMLFVLPRGQGDYQVRGDGLGLQVHRQVAEGSEVLSQGAQAAPGDRLGFKVSARQDGYLLVVGVDAKASVYPCWPQGDDPESRLFSATLTPVDLDGAMQLDATPGTERLVALHCEAPVRLSQVTPSLTQLTASTPAHQSLPPVRQGCVQDELRVVKP